MWNVTDEEDDVKLSSLSSKDKIVMLTTIQKFIEDAAVAEMIQTRYPKVWPLIVCSLDVATEELLGTGKATEVSVDRLTSKIDKLTESPLLSVLEAMIRKLEEKAAVQPAPVERPRQDVPPSGPSMDGLSPQEKADIISRRFASRGNAMPVGGF